jgi:AcrR family transcriptional regulator
VRTKASADPSTVILEAAERLCGERGLEAVSVREIAAEADVNLSAINYYFGSRINLLLTIFKTRVAELDQERRALLERASSAPTPDLREILRAVLMPLARWRTVQSNRRAALQFICRALTTAEPELKAMIDVGVISFRDVIALLQRALPHLSFEELCWRFHFMMSIEHMNFWDVGRLQLLSEGKCHSDDLNESLERAVDFAAAGFTAPVRVFDQAPASR